MSLRSRIKDLGDRIRGQKKRRDRAEERRDDRVNQRERKNEERRQLDQRIDRLVGEQQDHIDRTGDRDHDLQDKIEQARRERENKRTFIERRTDQIRAIRDRIQRRIRHIHAAVERREKLRREYHEAHEPPKPPASGVGVFDGKQVAAWMIPWLQRSRAAGWRGVLVSGWRDPAYSEQLCYQMCGQPTCPGRCAGRNSNHSGSVYPAGAVDVSDYYNFKAIQFRIQSPLRNYLGSADPVHFSVSGR